MTFGLTFVPVKSVAVSMCAKKPMTGTSLSIFLGISPITIPSFVILHLMFNSFSSLNKTLAKSYCFLVEGLVVEFSSL